MTLSKLIAKLIDLDVEYGDLEVIVLDDDMIECPITDVSVRRTAGYGGDKVALEVGDAQ